MTTLTKKVSLNFQEVNKLNDLAGPGSVVSESEYINTLLDKNITVVQEDVYGKISGLNVTYSMLTVFSLTGIDYIVYKRIVSGLTEVRKIYIGE